MGLRILTFAVISGILVPVNLVGNTLVCIVILMNKTLKTPLSYLLLNLAVADILVGLSTIPWNIFGLLYKHPDGEAGLWFCRFVSSGNIKFVCGASSAFTLAAVAYERFQAVIHPLTIKEKVTKKKTLIFIIFCWIVPLFLALPWFWTVIYDEKRNPPCGAEANYKPVIVITAFLAGTFVFFFPSAVMAVLYGRVIRDLGKKHERRIEREQFAAYRLRKRITFMLVTVTVVYVLSWGIVLVMFVLDLVGVFHSRDVGTLHANISHTVVVFNSSVNAFLYALFSDQFRKGFGKIFEKCAISRRRVLNVNDNTHTFNGQFGETRVRRAKIFLDTKL